MSFNRYIPLVIATGIGVMSGFYIWNPMFRKYQMESKGTWQYEVVQQTRTEELKRDADTAAAATTAPSSSNFQSTTSPSGTPGSAQTPPAPGSDPKQPIS
ncbi:hypothetical protein BG011_000263 [Mortierella polycephala]|uniref:Uncharacterized protein n=1 Tax=Mortierella polycephala TaxID=41804 RepID=A0A9P6PJF8_9FUNG|nr:hypothetical protein BG011_000263 [Mortierella polycephala]